jgi:hypothetical protein
MKILFVTHPYPNYVPDLLMHGLRKLIGDDLVDYPRKACVYDGVLGLGVCPEDQRCPDWFPSDLGQIDRSDIRRKVQTGFFDFVVCDLRAVADLQHYFGAWPERCVIIDGEDAAHPILPGKFVVCRRETDGSDYAIPLPMALPEEIFRWITRYDAEPKAYTIGFLGSTRDDGRKAFLDQLSRRYGNTLFRATEIPSTENPVPRGRMSRDAYYRQLQRCQMVLSLSGAGHDTFRFWEHAACNGVHLAPRVPLFIPNDFEDQREIIRFKTLDGLCRRIDAFLEGRHDNPDLANGGRLKLLRHHLTTHRAAYFLNCITKAFNC